MLLIAVVILYSPLVPQLPLGPVGQVLSIETSDSKSNVASILNENSQSKFLGLEVESLLISIFRIFINYLFHISIPVD